MLACFGGGNRRPPEVEELEPELDTGDITWAVGTF